MRAPLLLRYLPSTLSCFQRSLHALLLALILVAPVAAAATATFSVGLDTDNNAATGCVLATVNGPVSGFEQVATTVVSTSTTGASVIRLERQACVGGTLGAPIVYDSGTWPVGLGNSTGGSAVIETSIPLSLLLAAGTMRAVVISGNGSGGQDATATFALALALEPVALVVPVPLSPWLLLPLSLLLLGAAAWWRRRHPEQTALLVLLVFVAGSGLVWAAAVIRDGNVGDWARVAPAVTDAAGDAPVNADIVAVFTQQDGTNLYVRIDADVRRDAVANQAPVVNAGTAQTITLPALAMLSGGATDDGLPNPPAAVTYAWTKVSGPGTVAFGDAANAVTSASFSAAGTYVLRLTAGDSALSASAEVTVTATPTTTANQAPTITQAAVTLTLPQTLDLDPPVTDDGLPNPPGALSYLWTQLSGPAALPPSPSSSFAPVAFSSTTTRATTVTFDPTGPGAYVLRLVASDGALSTGRDISVTVLSQPQAAPAIGPLPNQTIRLGETLSVALAGSDVNARDALTYSLLAAPAGATLVPAGSSRFRFAPDAGQVGTQNVTVQVRDATNRTAQASFNVTVQNANRAPQFTPASRASASTSVGASYARMLVATDPDVGDSLSYALISGPFGVTISAAGTLAWSPSVAQRGDHVVKAKVSDDAGAVDVAMFTLTVDNNAMPLARDDVYEVKENALLTVNAASGVLANDVDPDTGTSSDLIAQKLTDPALGSIASFATDGSFTYQAPATVPGDPFTVAKLWNAGTGSDRVHELVADLNGDGYPDIVTFDNNAGIRARSGQNGSQLWSADKTGATDCTTNPGGYGAMEHRVLADLDDSGHATLAQSTYCAREGSTWHDHILAFDHLGKVKWVSPPLSKPHPDIRRGATPVPPGGFTPGGVAYSSGLSVVRLTAGGAPVLLMNAQIPHNSGYTYYVDAANVGHYADCRAVTGLVADENVACRATLIISGTDGSVLQALITRDPAASPGRPGGPNALWQMPPIAMDIDGDGRVDLVSGTDVWMQNAAGGFDLAWHLSRSVNDTAVADLDGDGKSEIIHLRSSGEPDLNSRGIFIYSHDGQLKRHIPLQTYWFSPLTIADVDGDGRSDIVLGADGTVYAFRDDGQPIWAYKVPADVPDNAVFAPYYTPPAQSFWVQNAASQVYDLDGDGVAEVVFAGYGRIMILDGRTGVRKVDPYWTYNWSYNDVSALMLIDMNNDGHVDVVQNSIFQFNCDFVGADFATQCTKLVGPTVLEGGGSNNWRPGPKAFPNIQYRSTTIDGNAHVLHDTKVSRVFRTPEQQGTVRDPRLAQATSFTYAAGDGTATSTPARVIIDIVPDNQPPVFTSTPPRSLLQAFAPTPPGGLVTHYYDLAAVDPDAGDTISFSLKSAPSWVTMSGPARIRFEPTCGSYGYPCPWGWTTVVVTATDSRGASTDQIFIVNLTTTAAAVPNVVGMSFEAAKTALIAQELQGVQWVEAFSAQPAGTVLAQDAAAGATVGRFDDIRLTVSKGLQPVLVPNVVGLPQASAQARLIGLGFTLNVGRQFSATVPTGVVMTQSPAAATTQAPGSASLTVSAGNGLAVALSSAVMTADQTITIQPAAFDVDGNPVALPSLTYSIAPAQLPHLGSVPTASGTTISATATTLGAFTLTVTDPATSRTATARFAVMLPRPAGKSTNGQQFAALMSTLRSIDALAPALAAARTANDTTQMRALLAQLVTTWRSLDLVSLRQSNPIALPQGFAPTLEYLQSTNPALQPTPDDLLQQQVLRDAIDDLQEVTAAFRASGGGMTQLRALMDAFLDRSRRIYALESSEYGLVLNAPELIVLTSSVIPDFYEALTDELAVVAGLPRRTPDFPLLKHGRPGLKSTLAEISVSIAVDFVNEKVVEQLSKPYKNSKQFAEDLLVQTAWASAMSVARAYAMPYLQGMEINEVVSGASLSFRVFSAPYSFIEVPGRIDHPLLANVTIIGPDIVANAKEVLDDWWGKLKSAASFGKNALTNPDKFKNLDEVKDAKDQLTSTVTQITTAQGELKLIANNMIQTAGEIERGSCIFSADAVCSQLVFGDGIASVYSYTPPEGLASLSGLPLPMLMIVENKRTGQMFFATPVFLPQRN